MYKLKCLLMGIILCFLAYKAYISPDLFGDFAQVAVSFILFLPDNKPSKPRYKRKPKRKPKR
jgi:hypothetical protein